PDASKRSKNRSVRDPRSRHKAVGSAMKRTAPTTNPPCLRTLHRQQATGSLRRTYFPDLIFGKTQRAKHLHTVFSDPRHVATQAQSIFAKLQWQGRQSCGVTTILSVAERHLQQTVTR